MVIYDDISLLLWVNRDISHAITLIPFWDIVDISPTSSDPVHPTVLGYISNMYIMSADYRRYEYQQHNHNEKNSLNKFKLHYKQMNYFNSMDNSRSI